MMWSTLPLALAVALGSATALPAPDPKPQHPVIRLPLKLDSRRTESLSRRSVPMTDVNPYGTRPDGAYRIEVNVGTPPQPFSLLVDSGSAHLVLAGSGCNATTCRTFNHTFHSEQSSTFTDLDDFQVLGYGRGYMSGHWVQDTVTIDNFTIANHTFLLANGTRAVDAETMGSGILGLAWGTKDPKPYESMWQSHPNKTYGLWLARRNETDENGGSLTIGGVDESVIDGEIEWVDTVPGQIGEVTSGWWVPFQGFGFAANSNGTEVADTIIVENASALIDSGSSSSRGPMSVLDQIFRAVPGVVKYQEHDEWGYRASPELARNFSMSVTLGGKTRTMHPDDLWYCVQKPTPRCFSTFRGGNTNDTAWVIGANFMKNVYTAFRADPPSVGFAKLKDEVVGTTPNTTTPTTSMDGTSEPTGAGPAPCATTDASNTTTDTVITTTEGPADPAATSGGPGDAPGASSTPKVQMAAGGTSTSAASPLYSSQAMRGLASGLSVYLFVSQMI